MRGFWKRALVQHGLPEGMDEGVEKLTLGAFLPALDWGNGAGAAFFPDLGGYH